MWAVSFFAGGVVIGAGMPAVATRAPEGESTGADGTFAGGRVGKLIRTVSRDSAAPDEDELGGRETVMRTVSFFGSFESAMRIGRCLTRRILSLPKFARLEKFCVFDAT